MSEVTSLQKSVMVGRLVSPNSRPISLLAQLTNSAASGYLQISSGSALWSVYLENGKLTYASHSIDPFDRLDLHLRRLSAQISTLTKEVRAQVRQLFEPTAQERLSKHHTDYQAICWLVDQRHLNPVEAAGLIEGLVKEVMESFLLITEGNYEFIDQLDDLPKFCRLDLAMIVEFCRKRLQGWQSLGPQICSPYQRPYLVSESQSQQKMAPELQKKLMVVLKGLSFRHLATLLNQDEIKLAKGLQPYVLNGTILLREPSPPFDQLPKVPSRPVSVPQRPTSPPPSPLAESETPLTQEPTAPNLVRPTRKETYSIACIDDSPTILKEIKRFLEDESITVLAINDPLKALIQVIRLKPDLILLDIGLPNIDGYKLCRLLRNHSLFTTTPIVMVTGNTGIIDRAKAKFAGASDYLTKPFTKPELLKIVFKHLA
ncbi:MAG: response regulator [Leptolyngbyaceae bacterium]|nr:response regulator [Leptolyngbyaceae bacterium]